MTAREPASGADELPAAAAHILTVTTDTENLQAPAEFEQFIPNRRAYFTKGPP